MSYYDEDSEDEYYGYYGRNNHRKPQPDPAPPQPDPPTHTSCHYEDDTRGYDDGQGSYGNEHDTYSDHAKPDPHKFNHDDPNSPTPFEPDYHNTECTNTDREDDANDADWEDDGTVEPNKGDG
jgi:hypothetical protein